MSLKPLSILMHQSFPLAPLHLIIPPPLSFPSVSLLCLSLPCLSFSFSMTDTMTTATSHSFPEETELVERSTRGTADSALLFLNRSSGFSTPDDLPELKVMKIQSLCEIRDYFGDGPGQGRDVPLSAVRWRASDGSVSVYRREGNSDNGSGSPHTGRSDLEAVFDASATKWTKGGMDRGGSLGKGRDRGSAEKNRTQADDGTTDMHGRDSAPETHGSGWKRHREEERAGWRAEGQREGLEGEGDDEASLSSLTPLSAVAATIFAADTLQLWIPLKALMSALSVKLRHLSGIDPER